MGLLDFFFDKDKSDDRKLKKLEKRITNMYLQAAERQYSFHELAELGSTEAAWVLLQRFNQNNPNTTVDIEEKQLVFDLLVRMARDSEADVIGQAKRYVAHAEHAQLEMKDFKINWPMKVLERLLPQDAYVAFIAEVLQSCGTEYQRSVEHKQELLLRSTELKSPALAEQIARFVRDDNETIRFLAIDAALKQDGIPAIGEALFPQLIEEESNRILNKAMSEIVGRRDLVIPEELREAFETWLPDELGVHKEGFVYRRRR